MAQITGIQMFLVCVVLAVWYFGSKCSQNYVKYIECVFCGYFVGIVLGNPKMGLLVGGTVQLMSMGLYNFGGATVPNYPFGAAIGTAIACLSGNGIEYALTIAIPAATLMMQMDMLWRVINVFFSKEAEKQIDKGNYRTMQAWVYAACICPLASVVIPAIIILLNANQIDAVINMLPAWFMYGMKCAGSMLPAVGMALLLRYMDTKKYWPYLIVGFVMMTYLSMPIFAISLTGLALAVITFRNSEKQRMMVEVINTGGDDYDEL